MLKRQQNDIFIASGFPLNIFRLKSAQVTMNKAIPTLVSPQWLADNFNRVDIVTLDATFFLPSEGRDGHQEFLQEHIPQSQFFDIDQIADRDSPLPHMLPSATAFAASVGQLGIANGTHVIVYDNNSFLASARVWWTFRVFGHHRISVLDGGLRAWKESGRPMSTELKTAAPKRFRSDIHPALVCSLSQMLNHSNSGDAQIFDARSTERFNGSVSEPRPGLRRGHIPNSLNLPFTDLINTKNGQLNSPVQISQAFEKAGINRDAPVVTTCGSGVTASILALGLFYIGKEDVAVYDGSWSEWGGRADTPVSP